MLAVRASATPFHQHKRATHPVVSFIMCISLYFILLLLFLFSFSCPARPVPNRSMPLYGIDRCGRVASAQRMSAEDRRYEGVGLESCVRKDDQSQDCRGA